MSWRGLHGGAVHAAVRAGDPCRLRALDGRTGRPPRAPRLGRDHLEPAPALAEGARLFRTVGAIPLDPDIPPAGVRDAVFRQIPRERVVAVVGDSAAADGTDADLFVATLGRHFRHIRAFAPPMLAALRF